jgi:hypothetical protein
VDALLEQVGACSSIADRRLLLIDRTEEVAGAFDALSLARVQVELERHDLTKTAIQRWVDLVRAEQRRQRAAHAAATDAAAAPDDLAHRPQIDIAQMDIPRIAGQVVDAMLAANEAHLTWFRWGEHLARRRSDDTGREAIDRLDAPHLCSALARLCQFVRTSAEQVSICAPPEDIISDLLTCIDRRLPRLERVVTTPVFTAEGTLIQEPGYHPASGIYYLPEPALSIPRVCDIPTRDEMEHAKRLIFDELLVDFPLEDDTSRAHALCLLLERFARAMIDGNTPLYAIDAPAQGSGKGLLMQVLLTPACGRDGASSLSPTQYDEEWRKRLTSVLLEQPEVVAIDNVVGLFESAALASAVTATTWHDRLLGANQTVRVPVTCSWVANGNNLHIGGDLARRRIPIRLVPNVPEPSKRSGFRHRLPRWASEQRGDLIWAACTLIRYGLQGGRPTHTLGSFEAWAELMSTILNGCGIAGFLGHRRANTSTDPGAEQWAPVVTAWWETHGDALVTTSDLYSLLINQGIELPDCVRGETDEQKRVSLGKQLAKIRDRVFLVAQAGDWYRRVQVQRGEKSRTGASQWRLVDISPGSGGGPPPTPPVPPGAEGMADGAEGAEAQGAQPSALHSASECDCRGLQRVDPIPRARGKPEICPAEGEQVSAAAAPTLCNPLPPQQNGAAPAPDPRHPVLEPSAPPGEPEAAVQAALAAGQYAAARDQARQVPDTDARRRMLAAVQAAVFHIPPCAQPGHIRRPGSWRAYQQAAALIAGYERLTGRAPVALRGVGLDSFAEDELLTLVRKLRGEVAALGWVL